MPWVQARWFRRWITITRRQMLRGVAGGTVAAAIGTGHADAITVKKPVAPQSVSGVPTRRAIAPLFCFSDIGSVQRLQADDTYYDRTNEIAAWADHRGIRPDVAFALSTIEAQNDSRQDAANELAHAVAIWAENPPSTLKRLSGIKAHATERPRRDAWADYASAGYV